MRDMSTSCQNRGAHQQNRPMRPFVPQELSQPMGPEFRKPDMSLKMLPIRQGAGRVNSRK